MKINTTAITLLYQNVLKRVRLRTSMAQNLLDVFLQIEIIAFEYPETMETNAVLFQEVVCCF